MNDTINTILSRRSIRDYLPEQIKPNELDAIIKAGLSAPSAHNQQSWHFTVIQDKKIINDLNSAAKEVMVESDENYLKEIASDKNFNIFYNAPAIIVVAGEQSAIVPIIDCAAATENMVIAAESLNIGTCWIGLLGYLFKSDKGNVYLEKLKIPEGFEPYYAITLGYKASENTNVIPRREHTVDFI